MAFSGHNLTCIRNGRVIFEEINFKIAEESALIIKGPNGSGKSSLLRITAGLLRPYNGYLEWKNSKLGAEMITQLIAYMGHLDAIKPSLTVFENISFWGQVNKDKNLNIDLVLESLKLTHLIDMPAGYLSAGQKRRLNFARIFSSKAKFWILDEPTVSLDSKTSDLFFEILKNHLFNGGLAMIATHNQITIDSTKILRLG